jgi:hypothetical protein
VPMESKNPERDMERYSAVLERVGRDLITLLSVPTLLLTSFIEKKMVGLVIGSTLFILGIILIVISKLNLWRLKRKLRGRLYE